MNPLGTGHEERRVRLRDGRFYLLRPLHPGDEKRLQAFFDSHQPETIQMRYGYMVAQMSDARARELVGVDQQRDRAIALFQPEPQTPEILAVARYFLDPDGRAAEVAFVVHESWRRLGIASLLVRELLATARERGLKRLWAQVVAENQPALTLLRQLGFTSGVREEGVITCLLDLEPAPRRDSRKTARS